MKFFGTFLVLLALTGCTVEADVKSKPAVTFSQDEVVAIIHEAYKNGAQAGYTFCVNQKGAI